MNFRKLSQSQILGLLLVAGLILSLLLPLRLPRSVPAPGRIQAGQEWILYRAADGGILATYRDNVTGRTRHHRALPVDRGDVVEATFTAGRDSEGLVHAGDTLAVLRSNELQRRIAEVKRQLMNARGELRSMQTGAKPPVKEQARYQVARAEARVRLQEGIAARKDSLYQDGLIPAEEAEIARTTLAVARLDARIARAQLEEVMTGAKVAEITRLESLVEGYATELEVLQSRHETQTLTAPFAGRLSPHAGQDTMLMVRDTSRIMTLGIRWKDRPAVQVGDTVTVRIPGRNSPLIGTLSRIGEYARVINDKQLLPAIAKIHAGRVPADLLVTGKIAIGSERPMMSLWTFIKTLVQE